MPLPLLGKLRWSNVKRDNQLDRQGALDIVVDVALDELVVSILLVMLQGSTVMLQVDIFGTEVVVVLRHFGNIGTKSLHFSLKMLVDRGFPSGRLRMGM
ncbi:unnamed protein product [Prunus armeniaca]